MHYRTTLAIAALSLALAACNAPQRPTTDVDDGRELPFIINDELPRGTFGNVEGSFNGDLTVRGYAEIETVDEPFCTEDCEEFDYVIFQVLETGNDNLADFLGHNEGNAYVGAASVGLGCKDGDVIRYVNHSDASQMQTFVLSEEVSQAILDSTEDEPITLTLSKLPLEGGTEAPACYSHFTTIGL